MKNWIKETLFGAEIERLKKHRARDEEHYDRLLGKHLTKISQLEAELTALSSQHSALRAQRAVAWPKPAKRIPRPQILAAFAAPIDTGAGAALHQEIDDYLQDLLDQVSQPPSASMPETTRLHLAGGIEHVRLLQKHLLDLHAEASRKDAELEEKEDRG